jgi:hypothetical protein
MVTKMHTDHLILFGWSLKAGRRANRRAWTLTMALEQDKSQKSYIQQTSDSKKTVFIFIFYFILF